MMKKIACIFIMLICLFFVSAISFADSAELPASLSEIQDEAFYQNTSLTEVRVPNGTRTIGARAFAYSGLQKIYLPASVDSIDPTAFDGLTNDFLIVTPIDSYSHRYATNHHYRADIKESYTIDSDTGDGFTVESVIDSGQSIDVTCSVASDYSGSDNAMFVLFYGVTGNCIYRSNISLAALKRGYTCSFSKEEINQHAISPVITLRVNLKDAYTIASDIGDSFTVASITDSGSTIDVICHIASDYPDGNDTSFVLAYGIDGNQIIQSGISLQALKRGVSCCFSKDMIAQHNIPPMITLYINIKDSYTVTSEIGDSFEIKYIIDVGENVIVRCFVLSDYSADDNTKFTLRYGVDGNCMYRNGISLADLKRGYICDFSKSIINQYQIPPVISLRKE